MESRGGRGALRARLCGSLGSKPRSHGGTRQRWFALATACLLCALAADAALAGMSGQLGLTIGVRRIPSTLTDEIALDTPTEYALLQTSIASDLNVKVTGPYINGLLDAVVNMAGPEHAVAQVELPIEDLRFPGILIDKIKLVPEIWFAVPFESVTDVNNLTNAAVIPPGGPFFVTARVTTSFEVAGFAVKYLAMLEDINFPNPSAEFAPLFYELTDQDFAIGSLLYISWQSQFGASVNLTLGVNASPASTSVKGYSAPGTVEPGNCFASGSIGGICVDDLLCGFMGLYDARVGIGFHVSTTQTLSGTVSFSAKLPSGLNVGTSFSLLAGPGSYRGIQLTGSAGCFSFGLLLDEMDLTSLSAKCQIPLDMGTMKGTFSLSATGLDRGLTGIASGLTLTQGLFSAGTNVTFSQLGDDFGFASLSTQLTYRLSPGVLSVQATFGRFGLTRASFGMGVSF